MAGPEVIVLASMHDHGLLVDMALPLFDVPTVRPDIRVPIPFIVGALVDIARARLRDDHYAIGWRSHANFYLD
jgi:hypothetical protein